MQSVFAKPINSSCCVLETRVSKRKSIDGASTPGELASATAEAAVKRGRRPVGGKSPGTGTGLPYIGETAVYNGHLPPRANNHLPVHRSSDAESKEEIIRSEVPKSVVKVRPLLHFFLGGVHFLNSLLMFVYINFRSSSFMLCRSIRIIIFSADVLPWVMQVFCTHCEPNYSQPWTTRRQTSSTSTGFVTVDAAGCPCILTNAHSVDNAAVVQVSTMFSVVSTPLFFLHELLNRKKVLLRGQRPLAGQRPIGTSLNV